MILKVAMLQILPGKDAAFEAAFKEASAIISSIQGYLGHELQRCLEVSGRYVLLARWQSLEGHTVRFRGSPEYQRWKQLLHHFYDPFPLSSTLFGCFDMTARGVPPTSMRCSRSSSRPVR